MTLRRTMVSVLAFWLVAMLLPTSASAQFRLRIHDNYGNGVVIIDNGEGDELDFIDGEIQHTLMAMNEFGQVEVSFTTAYSKGSPFPTLGPSELRLTSFQLHSSAAVTLTLTLEDTSFTSGAPGPLTLANSISGTFCGESVFGPTACGAGSEVMLAATSYANANNDVPNFGPPQGTLGPINPIVDPATASTQTDAIVRNGSGPNATLFTGATSTDFEATQSNYSLYTQIVVSFSGAGDVDFIQNTSTSVRDELPPDPVPEPASILLIATGVLGVAAKRRRSRRLQ